MYRPAPLVPMADVPRQAAARVRVIYGDTDKMGVVYHANYLRYMEHGRVEFIRQSGMSYARMERDGFALPAIELATEYRAAALYDDLVTVEVGLSHLTRARIHFSYRLVVEPGGREGLESPLEVLRAESRHCCLHVPTGRPARLPGEVYEVMQSCYTHPGA